MIQFNNDDKVSKNGLQAERRITMKKNSQAGFSLIESMLSVGILGIFITAYLMSQGNGQAISQLAHNKQNVVALRRFIDTNFSCEKTIETGTIRTKGIITGQKCPSVSRTTGKIVALNHEGNEMMGHVANSKIGRFAVESKCNEESTENPAIKIPTFKFLARPLDSFGKPMKDPRNPKKLMAQIDVFDGLPIRCNLPDEPSWPLGKVCTIGILKSGNSKRGARYSKTSSTTGVPTSVVNGFSFREGKKTAKTGSTFSFSLRTPFDALSPALDFGKPTHWEYQFVNKNPIETVGKRVMGKTDVDNMVPPLGGNVNLMVAATTKIKNPIPECSTTPANLQQQSNCFLWREDVKLNGGKIKTESNWFAAPVDFRVAALYGSTVLARCSVSFTLMSPLVLSWRSTREKPQEFNTKMASFDVDHSGKSENISWVFGEDVAYLAIDLNRNNRIDDGGELFGQGTMLKDQTKATNGFLALSSLDTNKDGFVDAQDADFKNLKLWFDENGNAASEPWELFSLSDRGVNKISVAYKPTQEKPVGDDILTQFVYEGTFYGPGICEDHGCRVYDVFYGTQERSPKLGFLK